MNINVIDRDDRTIFNPQDEKTYRYSLKFVQEVSAGYIFKFERTIVSDLEITEKLTSKEFLITVDNFCDVADIMRTPDKYWNIYFNVYKNSTPFTIYIRVFSEDQSRLPQVSFSNISINHAHLYEYDKIIKKYTWESDAEFLKEQGFSPEGNEPIYKINLWFDIDKTVGDRMEEIKRLISEYESNTNKERDDN